MVIHQKQKIKIYLHSGSIADGSSYYYEYLTVSITCNIQAKYVLDGVILPLGPHIEDYVEEMLKFVKQHLSIGMVLFDKGFTSWGIIYKLRKLTVPYLIFFGKNWGTGIQIILKIWMMENMYM